MSDGTTETISVYRCSGQGYPWFVAIQDTVLETFARKAQAVKYARAYAKDMRRSEGTKATLKIEKGK